MADLIHKYYCTRCDRFVYENNLLKLAAAVNYHATAYHPSDFANWTAENIVSSAQYSGASGPLPQYLAIHGTTSHKDSVLPELTTADKAMLAENLIKW